MSRRKAILVGLVALAALSGTGAQATADEVATITNDTDTNIELFLKWSQLTDESTKLVLAPGESIRQQAPPGCKLYMRFNSTPNVAGPPKEVKLQVVTAGIPDGKGPGAVSIFKRLSPSIVGLTRE